MSPNKQIYVTLVELIVVSRNTLWLANNPRVGYASHFRQNQKTVEKLWGEQVQAEIFSQVWQVHQYYWKLSMSLKVANNLEPYDEVYSWLFLNRHFKLKMDTSVKQTPWVGPWLSFTPFIWLSIRNTSTIQKGLTFKVPSQIEKKSNRGGGRQKKGKKYLAIINKKQKQKRKIKKQKWVSK